MQLHSVAPRELIVADYELLKSYERLDTTPEIQDLLLTQSIEGRAHNGSGVFDKRTYVNTTIDDVVKALDLNPDEIKARRQSIIDDIFHFAEDCMNGVKRERLINNKGEAILGIEYFFERKVNAPDVVRGLYLGGLRDNPDIRKEAEKIYKMKIGGGRCYVIDIAKMLEMNLDGERLAHEEHEADIPEFQKKGLIVSTQGAIDPATQRYFYIRHRVGPGQSDDAAFIIAGILYNPDVALGVFLADAIDTLEKYAPVYNDQDGALSFQIGRGFKHLELSMDDVYELVSLSAIPEPEEHLVPDSSMRYLLAVDQRTAQCAFRTHLNFIENKPVAALPVSFKRILSTQFYTYIKRRLVNVRNLEKFALPNVSEMKLDVPITQLMNKEFSVILKDAPLADVVRKFKETKHEIIVVVDKSGKVVGTMNPVDLLHILDTMGSSQMREHHA